MSYCRYTATGEYKCNTIEHMSKVSKTTQPIPKLTKSLHRLTKSIPQINEKFDNFNMCKSFLINNKVDQIQTLYNTNKSLPQILEKYRQECDEISSSKKINLDLKNYCYMVNPTSTIVPKGDNIQNIINKNDYKDDSNDYLFTSKQSICNIGNDNYVLCNNTNIINKINSGIESDVRYCFKSISNNRFNQSKKSK